MHLQLAAFQSEEPTRVARDFLVERIRRKEHVSNTLHLVCILFVNTILVGKCKEPPPIFLDRFQTASVRHPGDTKLVFSLPKRGAAFTFDKFNNKAPKTPSNEDLTSFAHRNDLSSIIEMVELME